LTAVRRSEEPIEPAPKSGIADIAAGRTFAERARLFVLLGGLTAFGPLSIDMYLPALPMIARDLQASESVIQLTLE
jgi:DHA1 family bicyclomycin/chloramphenicol resistance-like MFS transporter